MRIPRGASEPGRRRSAPVHEDHGRFLRPGRRGPGRLPQRLEAEYPALRQVGRRRHSIGLPLYYATAMPLLRRSAMPLLAETHQGVVRRSWKRNPSLCLPHGGASSLAAQASLLELRYDPGSRDGPRWRAGRPWTTPRIKDRLAAIGNASMRPTAAPAWRSSRAASSSPTSGRGVRRALPARFPKAVWAEYEPVVDEPPLAAAQAVFGGNCPASLYRFSPRRKVVVNASDCQDFLERGSRQPLLRPRVRPRPARDQAGTNPMKPLCTPGGKQPDADRQHGGITGCGWRAATMLALAGSPRGPDHRAMRARFAPTWRAAWTSSRPAGSRNAPRTWRANKGESLVVVGAHLPGGSSRGVAHAINAWPSAISGARWILSTRPGLGVRRSWASQLRGGDPSAGGVREPWAILGGNLAYNNAPGGPRLGQPAEVRRRGRPLHGYHVDETSAHGGVAASRPRTTWNPGATAGRWTASSCRSSR